MFMAHYVFHKTWDSDVHTVIKDRYGSGIDHWKELEGMGILQDVSTKQGRASFRMSEDALLILALVL